MKHRPKITDFDLDYDEDLEVDPHNLHEEWVRQVNLENHYGKLLVVARDQLSDAHERVKVVRSELIKRIKSKGGKPTQQEVEGYYRRHKRHKRAKEDMIEAEYVHGMIQNAVWRLGTKKTALQELVKLFLSQYYSGPEDPKGFEESFTELAGKKVAREKVRRKMKRKSKRTK